MISISRRDDFLNAHGFHAAKVERAFTQKTGAAFDLVPNDPIPLPERASQAWFRRAKYGHDRDAKQRGQMHRPGVVSQQEAALSQLLDQLLEGGLANQVEALITQCRGNLGADRGVPGGAEKHPLHPIRRGHGSKALRQPALCGSIFCPRAKPDSVSWCERSGRGRDCDVAGFRVHPQ